MRLELKKKVLLFGIVAICLSILSSCLDKDDGSLHTGTDTASETLSSDVESHPITDAIQDAVFVDIDVEETSMLDLVTEDEELFDVFETSIDVPQETQADVEENEKLPKDPTDDPDQHSAFYSFPAWEVPPSSDDEE